MCVCYISIFYWLTHWFDWQVASHQLVDQQCFTSISEPCEDQYQCVGNQVSGVASNLFQLQAFVFGTHFFLLVSNPWAPVHCEVCGGSSWASDSDGLYFEVDINTDLTVQRQCVYQHNTEFHFPKIATLQK